MAVDAERGPPVELGIHVTARRARHQAERVAAEIRQGSALLARQLELAA
jgi:hypothetical protein